MNRLLRNELAEICILSIIRKGPINGCRIILEIDKWIGIENLTHEFCFYELRKKGYCSVIFDDQNEERMGLYCITSKGLERLSDFLALQNSIKIIYESLCDDI